MNSLPSDSPKIPVAHVVLGLRVGGLERVVVNLVQGLARSRFQPIVICLEEGGEFVEAVEKCGVPVHVLGKKPGMDWRAAHRLSQSFREHNVQIVHTHNPVPHFHGVLASLLAAVPIRIHTKHGRNYPKNKKKVLLNRLLSWFTDAIVPVSDDARDVAVQIEHVNPGKVRRIWNGVDTDLHRPNDCAESRFPVIGTVARLSPEKDQATMLVAFREVLSRMRDARLVFCGDGPCRTELSDQATQLGIADHVDFLGARADVPAVLNTFSIFTLSSTTEGLSMTLLEAMAAGLPIVATDVGGNRELVNPTECGLIVPPREPKALAEAFLALLRDPVQRICMGNAARARVVANFSLQFMVGEYLNLYEAVVSRKRVNISP